MKQAQKNDKVSDNEARMACQQINLREQLSKLSKVEQEAVSTYFNLYNATAWHYNEVLSQDARDFVDASIAYQREVMMLEQSITPESTPNDVQSFVDKFNEAEKAM